ncbi:unnamed protein product [Nezara viridula]|uniref:Tumor protein D54 n=1 Tax=Nezara viridula TaxID=85310 RepID=A0A9P0HND5_NEZVI|nr:unnamed protein product [Nezara viridula]
MSNALQDNIRLNEDDIEDFTSLEYEEDCFYALVSKSETPSFDIEESDWDEENGSMFVLVDEEEFDPPPLDLPEQCTVETEFYNKKLGKNKFIKAVRVKFQDLSKPYLAKITSQKNYTKFLQLVNGEKPHGDMSPDSGINELAGLSPEEQERQKKEWADELVKVEEEIQTLRHVLASKVKVSHELKRKLGFSVWREFQDDMSQGIKNVKESNVYQKTESVIKATTEKTSSILGGLGSGISSKIGQLKNSESFRSFEERMGSAYENVKTKVSTSRSSSMQSFDDALRDVERDMDRKIKSPVTTPTINEERPS